MCVGVCIGGILDNVDIIAPSLPLRSALELDCKPVSKKVRKAHIGVTLESEYIKEGVAKYVHTHLS